MSSAATRSTSSTASSVSSTWSPRVVGNEKAAREANRATESRTRVLEATMQGPSDGFQRQTVSRAQRRQGQATSAGGHSRFSARHGRPTRDICDCLGDERYLGTSPTDAEQRRILGPDHQVKEPGGVTVTQDDLIDRLGLQTFAVAAERGNVRAAGRAMASIPGPTLGGSAAGPPRP